ncbi:uncharacterized protein [Drosophila bipectinata]|uniref:uncharacterized protein n=1 Tax=Drosophila bipectinata TaxID=42026 RepID=UPI0038B369B0
MQTQHSNMKKIVLLFLAVMASAVKSLPVMPKISEKKPDENSKAEYYLENQRQPRADVYPLFLDYKAKEQAKNPLVTNVGHALFPQNFYKLSSQNVVEDPAKTSEKTTTSVGKDITNTRTPIPIELQFYPKAQNDGGTDKNSNNAPGSGGSENQKKPPKELTISLPRHKTDEEGKWVYNPWGVTYPNVWKFTRQDQYYWIWDFKSQGLYKTMEPHPTVCFGKSTVYNVPPIMKWLLKKSDRASLIGPKALLTDLRMEIYLQGKSETCHTNQYVEVRPYVECALLRNMRMEYLMPQYPMHQTGNFWAL